MKGNYRVLIISEETETANELDSALKSRGFICVIARAINRAVSEADLVLIDLNGSRASNGDVKAMLDDLKNKRNIPVMALVREAMLDTISTESAIDDFVVKPWNVRELTARMKRILEKSGGIDSSIITCSDLHIDTEKCEVSLGSELLELTFTEYELLKFLASNRGKVFTREALLNAVWGYDYYGGERTVDVHIRRLRSKIEDVSHTFIETVRNIGYKFDNYSGIST